MKADQEEFWRRKRGWVYVVSTKDGRDGMISGDNVEQLDKSVHVAVIWKGNKIVRYIPAWELKLKG